jgi:hypothetical protein
LSRQEPFVVNELRHHRHIGKGARSGAFSTGGYWHPDGGLLCRRSLVRFVDGDTEYNRPRMAVLHEFVDRDDVAAATLHEILT